MKLFPFLISTNHIYSNDCGFFGQMHNGHHMFGYGGGPITLLLLLLSVGAVITLIYFTVNKSKKSNNSALDILKQRYAKGELSQKEYQQMKKEL